MPELTAYQIRILQRDLEQSGLRNNLLKHEMLDHLCCEVEAEMERGLTFREAYDQSSLIHSKRELSKTRRNISFFVNYRSMVTAGLLYLGVILFCISWFLHLNQADWLGLASFLLVSFVFFRYSILFYSNKKLSHPLTLSFLAGIVFVFFLTGSIFRFLWLNYGLSNPHVMPMLVFSWLLLAILSALYYRDLLQLYPDSGNKRNIRIYLYFTQSSLILAIIAMSTFFLRNLQTFIPQLAGGIVIINIILFIVVFFMKQVGKRVIQSLLISSFLMVFIYFPLRSLWQPEGITVTFDVISESPLDAEHLYLHVNYFKHGKETLVLYRQKNSVYQSDPITIRSRGIEMACKITEKRGNTYDILYDEAIMTKRLQLKNRDTTFTLHYNPSLP